ncbi:MAG: GntR family transcriptional regulator [Thermoleophilia bacterium]
MICWGTVPHGSTRQSPRGARWTLISPGGNRAIADRIDSSILDDLVIERPQAIRKRVYDNLRSAILEQHIAPGTRLVEAALATAIGVSRTPVREALHLLEREGLVTSTPRVGYHVRAIEWSEIEQACEIRVVNETLAACWAIDRLTPGELARLEANVAACEADLAEGHIERFAEHDAAFHETLARASGSDRLFEICQTLRRHMVLFRARSFQDPEAARLAARGHRRILERLAAGDKEGVAEAVRAHLEDAKGFIASCIAERPENTDNDSTGTEEQ